MRDGEDERPETAPLVRGLIPTTNSGAKVHTSVLRTALRGVRLGLRSGLQDVAGNAKRCEMGTIDQFVGAVREVFANTKDARAQAQGIAKHMKVMLADPNLMQEIERKGGGKPGRIDLHIDDTYGHPGPGFCLMTSLTPKGKATGGARAHDHGASFVVYGVFKGAIEQTKYTWEYTKDGDFLAPELRPGKPFVQKEGDIAYFLPGEIHKTSSASDDPPIVLRLEAQLLDRVERHRYDLETNKALSHA